MIIDRERNTAVLTVLELEQSYARVGACQPVPHLLVGPDRVEFNRLLGQIRIHLDPDRVPEVVSALEASAASGAFTLGVEWIDVEE